MILTGEKNEFYTYGDCKDMRFFASEVIEAYILSSAKEKRIGFRGLKGEEDDS